MSPAPGSTPPGSAPLKSSRKVCYEARDLFYACVRDLGIDFRPGVPIPDQCKSLRATFEKSCLTSWVKHFDEQQEAEARRARFLHKVIGDKADGAAGSLSGKA